MRSILFCAFLHFVLSNKTVRRDLQVESEEIATSNSPTSPAISKSPSGTPSNSPTSPAISKSPSGTPSQMPQVECGVDIWEPSWSTTPEENCAKWWVNLNQSCDNCSPSGWGRNQCAGTCCAMCGYIDASRDGDDSGSGSSPETTETTSTTTAVPEWSEWTFTRCMFDGECGTGAFGGWVKGGISRSRGPYETQENQHMDGYAPCCDGNSRPSGPDTLYVEVQYNTENWPCESSKRYQHIPTADECETLYGRAAAADLALGKANKNLTWAGVIVDESKPKGCIKEYKAGTWGNKWAISYNQADESTYVDQDCHDCNSVMMCEKRDRTLDSGCSDDGDCDTNLLCSYIASGEKACRCPPRLMWDEEEATCIDLCADIICDGEGAAVCMDRSSGQCDYNYGSCRYYKRAAEGTVCGQGKACNVGGECVDAPTDCVRDDVATKANCTATCGTVDAVVRTRAANGGDSCSAYECQPEDGECKAIDCRPDVEATKKSCPLECGKVDEIPEVAPLFGRECGKYKCKHNDGACRVAVDCQTNFIESAKLCTEKCLPVTAVETVASQHGGKECSKYQCKDTDGKCKGPYVNIVGQWRIGPDNSYDTCELGGMDSILTVKECKAAAKALIGRTLSVTTVNKAGQPYGCHMHKDSQEGNPYLRLNTMNDGDHNCVFACFCRVRKRTPTMRPTMNPTVSVKRMKFTMTISMNETTVAENKDLLRQSVATQFGTTISKVSINVVQEAARRILNTDTKLEVEIIDIQPDDVEDATDLLTKSSFEADLAALIKENTKIEVTISSVSDPDVTPMNPPSPPSKPAADDKVDDDGSSGGAGGAVAAVLSVLVCCCCVGGAYYMFTQQSKLAWEVDEEGMEEGKTEETGGETGEVEESGV